MFSINRYRLHGNNANLLYMPMDTILYYTPQYSYKKNKQ